MQVFNEDSEGVRLQVRSERDDPEEHILLSVLRADIMGKDKEMA